MIQVHDCEIKADANGKELKTHQIHKLYHPVYTTGFRCEDVIFMEKTDGRHEKSCPFAGYIPAKKCGCNGPSK